MTVHGLVPQCALSVLSFSECKIAKIFQGFAPDPTRHPPKITEYGTERTLKQWLCYEYENCWD